MGKWVLGKIVKFAIQTNKESLALLLSDIFIDKELDSRSLVVH